MVGRRLTVPALDIPIPIMWPHIVAGDHWFCRTAEQQHGISKDQVVTDGAGDMADCDAPLFATTSSRACALRRSRQQRSLLILRISPHCVLMPCFGRAVGRQFPGKARTTLVLKIPEGKGFFGLHEGPHGGRRSIANLVRQTGAWRRSATAEPR